MGFYFLFSAMTIGIAVLIYLHFRQQQKISDLTASIVEFDQVEQSMTSRIKSRCEEVDFLKMHAGGFISDIAAWLSDGQLKVSGMPWVAAEQLRYIYETLQVVPGNYLLTEIKSNDLYKSEEFESLNLLLESSPSVGRLRYIELVGLSRVMLSQQLPAEKALRALQNEPKPT